MLVFFLKISAVTFTTACARVRFCFWKASASAAIFSLRSCTACARVLSLCMRLPACAGPLARGRSRRRLILLSATRRQRRKVDKCRVADKKKTDRQINTHCSFIGIDELTKVGSDQRSSTIQYDSKSKHSKSRQTVNWTWEVACLFSFSLFVKISAVTYDSMRARVRFCFWKALAQRFFSLRSCTACARVLSLCMLAPATTALLLSGTRRQRRKVDKCRVADKKKTDKPTDKQTNKHTLLFYRYRSLVLIAFPAWDTQLIWFALSLRFYAAEFWN